MELDGESQFDEVIEEMQDELSPPTLQEFELGMALSCLMDAIINPEDWSSYELRMMLSKSDEILAVWLDKYETMMLEYNALGEE